MINLGNRKKRGNKGEDLAVRYLTSNGYHVIERNYLKREGEIDIVAKKDSVVIFIEVKSRFIKQEDELLEPPESTISNSKIAKIRKTATAFIKEKKLSPDEEYRCDVISIIIGKNKTKIKHIKYAF
ncbi:MAG: YraN family protein [Patescibacteria group bacterium]|nr:YraN family protein [Patescibacteria group bacterium]